MRSTVKDQCILLHGQIVGKAAMLLHIQEILGIKIFFSQNKKWIIDQKMESWS